MQGIIKPLSVQNNQIQSHNNPVLFKHEPLIKLEEIASVTHPLNDLLNIEQIKTEVEDPDETIQQLLMDET